MPHPWKRSTSRRMEPQEPSARLWDSVTPPGGATARAHGPAALRPRPQHGPVPAQPRPIIGPPYHRPAPAWPRPRCVLTGSSARTLVFAIARAGAVRYRLLPPYPRSIARSRALSCGAGCTVSREWRVLRQRGGAWGAVSRELPARWRPSARSLTLTWSPAMDPPRTGRSLRGRGRPACRDTVARDIASPSAPPNGAVPGRGGPSGGRAAPSPPRCLLPPGDYSEHLMAATRFIFVSCSLDVGLAVNALCFLLY